MQMFILDADPVKSAVALADTHIRVIGREITMCLSSWYAHNIGYPENLPYKPFNHPVVEEMSNPYTRVWACANAHAIFREFKARFNKQHASEAKFLALTGYRFLRDSSFYEALLNRTPERARFSFIEKGTGVQTNLPAEDAVKLYRGYYRSKLESMKVPVTYTNQQKPEWLEAL